MDEGGFVRGERGNDPHSTDPQQQGKYPTAAAAFIQFFETSRAENPVQNSDIFFIFGRHIFTANKLNNGKAILLLSW